MTPLATASAARNALVLIAVVVAGAALRWLGDILTPLALAVFLMVMIDSFARVMRNRAPRVPAAAVYPLVIALFVLGFGLTAYLVGSNTTTFVGRLLGDAPRLNALMTRIGGALHLKTPSTIGQLFGDLDPSKYLGGLAEQLQGFASHAVFVGIYLGFLLASRHGFRHKADRLFPNLEERQHAVQVFVRIRDGVERYLWIQTVFGLGVAVASWGLMAAVGLDSPVFWAFLIFISSFIPIIGGLVGILLPPLFAVVQFDTYWQAATLLVTLFLAQFIAGNILLPRMQGKSLNLDPVVVLLALTLWGAIWGVPGMFLSTPLTVMAMVILVQFSSTKWIAILLSGDGDPEDAISSPALIPPPPMAAHAVEAAS